VKKLIILVAALFLADTAHAQLELDVRRIRPGTDSMVMYLVRGADTTRAGEISDEIAVAREGGSSTLRRVHASASSVTGMDIDTLVDDAATLRPIRARGAGAMGSVALDFAAGRITGWARTDDGDSVAVDTTPEGVFYNSSTLDLVIRAAPLRDGWTAEIPVYLSTRGEVVPIRAAVAASETVDGVACWRVEVDFTGMPVTFWIEKDSRAMARQVMRMAPGVEVLFRRAGPAPGRARAETR